MFISVFQKWMIQQEKPQLPATMPVVWPTLLDFSRDDCKRILRKLGETLLITCDPACEYPIVCGTLRNVNISLHLVVMCICARIGLCVELEAYAGVISALRAQGDLTKDKKDLLGELTKVLR